VRLAENPTLIIFPSLPRARPSYKILSDLIPQQKEKYSIIYLNVEKQTINNLVSRNRK